MIARSQRPARIALRVPEVAVAPGVSERTVRTWIAAGKLRVVRLGWLVLVRQDALEELLGPSG